MKRNVLIFLMFLIVGILDLYPQYMFRHWDIVDGMSDNQIRGFTMTLDSRMVIRTVSNLNVYNGASFEHFYLDRRKDYKWDFNHYQIFKEYHDAEGRLWMKSPGYLSIFDFKTNQFIYNVDSVLVQLGINRKLKNLFIDSGKNYWFVTDDNSSYFYDITAGKLNLLEKGSGDFTLKYGVPHELSQYRNFYYILYSSGLIQCRDRATQEVVFQDTYFIGKITEKTDRLNIISAATGDLWLMNNYSVSYYNHVERHWTEIATIKGASNFFTCMEMDKDGNIWVGTSWSGLRKIDANSHAVETISGLRLSNGGILNNDIQCLFADDNGGLWVGTLWQGMCYFNPSMYKFGLIQSVQNETLITNESVRCLLEDFNGDILIGTTNFGLKRYNTSTGEISNAFDKFLLNDLCLSLYRDSKNRIWVGTYLNGFYCIDSNNRVINYNKSNSNIELYPNQNISRAIYEDSKHRFWVSVANEGVGELNLETGAISMLKDKHPEIAFHKLDYDFYPVNDSTFAVYGENGIYYYNTQNDDIFIPESDSPDNPKYAGPNIRYYCIYKDSRNFEWFGTEQGIRIWDDQKKQVYIIDVNDGLPNNSISSILEDQNGIYWVSTVGGITQIKLTQSLEGSINFELVNFDTEDGLQKGKFYDRSSLKSRSGNFYFGGHHGVNWFNPQEIHFNKGKNKPVFSAFYLFNTLIKANQKYKGRTILNTPINNSSKIELAYNQNFISLEFAGLNYVNPSHTYYRYKLENYDQDWNEIKTSGVGSATYTGLQPGKYKLIVYTANNDKLWGDTPAEMEIIISPPFWMTIYAYIFYFVLLVVISLTIIKQWEKKRLKQQKEKELREQNRQKEELDQMKFRFFTNISHEFRTPLTLIMTPLNTLIQQAENPMKDKLRSIYRNANDMLGLINQLLDFRKLEMGGEKINLSLDDFIEFVKYIHSSFNELAVARNIVFSIECEPTELNICFDKPKMHKVLNNLYSNALKFTPDGGYVSTILKLVNRDDKECILVEISDSGCGIDEKDLESVFDRFYQVNTSDTSKSGWGIGLHLVKEYVILHHGQINLRSKKGEGSTFELFIPTDLKDDSDLKESVEVFTSKSDDGIKYSGTKTVLVVEDNQEFQHFLVEQLKVKFKVITANDGAQGEKLAVEKSPDLIVSDLMMPLVDGLELCNRLKHNIQTSHIPFILLTARLSDDARIDSYKAGADSYISKPFNMEVLLARIEMLFEQLEKRKETFHKTIEISPSTITISSLDEEFVKKAVTFVETNIDNSDYSVNHLSEDMAMSRTQLYRKFESITGQSPNDFIRSIRLKRAAQLLMGSAYNISEISGIVGFNSIKYFNKYFKEQFGLPPTQYRNKHTGQH